MSSFVLFLLRALACWGMSGTVTKLRGLDGDIGRTLACSWWINTVILRPCFADFFARVSFGGSLVNHRTQLICLCGHCSALDRYNLGPNGGILTALNLFTTKFDQVLELVEKRAEDVEYVVISTPLRPRYSSNQLYAPCFVLSQLCDT